MSFVGQRNLNQSRNSPENSPFSPTNSEVSPKQEAYGYINSKGQFAKCKLCRPGSPCRWHGGKFRVTGSRKRG